MRIVVRRLERLDDADLQSVGGAVCRSITHADSHVRRVVTYLCLETSETEEPEHLARSFVSVDDIYLGHGGGRGRHFVVAG